MKRLWNNSLAAKFFLSYLAAVIVLSGAFYFFSGSLIGQFHIATLSTRMEQEAQLLSRTLPFDQEGLLLDELCRDLAQRLGARITVIAPDGKVRGDSAKLSTNMENHAARPEVAEALRSGSGSAIRYSTTVRDDMLYRAFYQINSGQGRVVRLATPLKEVEETIRSVRGSLLQGLLMASLLGLLIPWALARYLSSRFRRVVEFSGKVAQGSFPQNFFPTQGRDEIAMLERHLIEMSSKIHNNLNQVNGEKETANSILRCMIEGVLVLDPKGKVLVINDQAKAMFHVLPALDIHSASLMEVSRHPEIHAVFEEVLSHDFSEELYSKEIELEEEHWFRVNAAILRDGNSAARGTILVFHDISDIKRFERVRTDFVANVSHELRTPLTAIRGYVETLLHTPPTDPADMRQFLEIIDRHSERLTRLTEDLLVLSDLESGKIQIARPPIDAAQLIQRALEIFCERAIKKQIQLKHLLRADLPQLAGDPDRLQQLFINLIDNAVKYTPAGGQVTVTATPAAASGSGDAYLEISVSDTGFGIPEKDLPRLTERFYRVDKARSRELGGTGLGLAIVKHIVQAHHGELKFESVVNKGTTVRVWLPIAQHQEALAVSLH